MKKKENILMCCNEVYAMPCIVTLTSILENLKEKANIYIFHSKLSLKSISKFKDLEIQYKINFFLIMIPENYFSSINMYRWSKEIYYRMCIGDFLPNYIERIIYLDCDMIVKKDISNLFYLDIKDNCFAAVKENFLDKKNLNQVFNFNFNNYDYFNSGFLIIDVNKVRNILKYENVLPKIKFILEKNKNNLCISDQDFINYLFAGKFFVINKKYNDIEIDSDWDNKINKDIKEECIVVHYLAGKPWNKKYIGVLEDEWFKYLKLSPYKYLWNDRYNTFWWRLKRIKLFKLLNRKFLSKVYFFHNVFLKFFGKDFTLKIQKFYRKYLK